MSVSTKTKHQAVARTFGVPVDPEDVDFIDFMYARRHLATVPERGWRELSRLDDRVCGAGARHDGFKLDLVQDVLHCEMRARVVRFA